MLSYKVFRYLEVSSQETTLNPLRVAHVLKPGEIPVGSKSLLTMMLLFFLKIAPPFAGLIRPFKEADLERMASLFGQVCASHAFYVYDRRHFQEDMKEIIMKKSG